MHSKSKRFLYALFALALLFGMLSAVPHAVFAQDIAEQDDTLLTEYINEHYPGKITVAIATSRPIANSRVAFDPSKKSAGHTSVRLDYGDGNFIVRGFTPANEMSILELIDNVTVEGRLMDEAIHDWNAAIVYEITLEQAHKIEDYIDNFDLKHFNAIFNNCTTFAVKALMAADIPPPTREHNWTLPGRDEIIEVLPVYVFNKEAFVNGLLSRIYCGYTPADAVQDFKANENCILKYDGALHKP